MTNQNQPSEVKEGGALEPCPFCRRVPAIKSRAGEKGETPEVWSITCFGDGNNAHAWFYAATEAEAIAAWNRRPPSMERGEAVVARLKAWLDHGNPTGGMNLPTMDGTPSIRDDLRALLAADPSPAPSAVEMAGVDREAIARIIDDLPWRVWQQEYEFYKSGSQKWTDKQARANADSSEGVANMSLRKRIALETADAILALATASRGKGDGAARELSPATEKATPESAATGRCAERKRPGGCRVHNLFCGYPECDKYPASMPQTGGEA